MSMVATPDCKLALPGPNPALHQHRANSVSPVVGYHLGWHSTVSWLREEEEVQNRQKNLKIFWKKK
jgi:hypothetical protein